MPIVILDLDDVLYERLERQAVALGLTVEQLIIRRVERPARETAELVEMADALQRMQERIAEFWRRQREGAATAAPAR